MTCLFSCPCVLVFLHRVLDVVIKTISPPLSKKYKNKRKLKTETRNDPTMTHIYTQMNIHEHWSWRPIRRGVPIGDDRQAPDWRQYDREESQRRTHIHAQTQDHMEQTAECCHRGITTNRHTIYLETSNRIHPVQGGFHPSLRSIPILFFFHHWELLTGAPIHTEGTDTKTH